MANPISVFGGDAGKYSAPQHLDPQIDDAADTTTTCQSINSIAHDINNYLAVMIGNVEQLSQRISGDQAAKKRIDAIAGAVDDTAALTRRLTKLVSGQTLLPAPTDVPSVILELEKTFRRILGKRTAFKADLISDIWPVTVDPRQFEKALICLAINARDAMPEGGELAIDQTNVTLDKTYVDEHEGATQGDFVNVAVRDTGIGMTPEVLKKAFAPFFTTRTPSADRGLGLSMVYGFAKQSGGYVTAESRRGHGTIINLYLPRANEGGVECASVSSRFNA
jgi:signal transduction histidine kinase